MKWLIFITPILLYSLDLKIATYNVENLFDDKFDGTEYKEYIPNKHNWTKAILNKKIEHISQVICDLNADVIALEEVENKHALNLLQKYLNRVGCKYKYSAITNKNGSAIQVALLSKVPIKSAKDIRVSYSKNDRDILEVTLNTNPPLTIFANHWRSKSAPESQRLKYAKALIKRIKKMPKGKEYIILGDFNSAYNECINISKKNNDTNGVCGIDTLLKTYYNGRLIKFRDKINLDFYHYNLWSELGAHKRWSYDFYGKKSAIDSIIIPPSLNDKEGWFYKKGTFNVFKKRYLFKKHNLNRWEYKHSKHTGRGYSDHLPIYAIFSNSLKKELKHETLLDKFWKLFIPTVKEEKKAKKIEPKVLSVDEYYKLKYIKEPIILKNMCVIYKRGDFGVVKSSPNSKAITLYKSAEGLKEGICYDIKVYRKKKYYKLDEITDLDILKERKRVNVEKYIPKFSADLMDKNLSNIGEIIKDIEGIYKNGYIMVDNNRYKLYLKEKKRGLLKKNSYLYIKKAQIGYYKGEKELIVYSLKDIKKR